MLTRVHWHLHELGIDYPTGKVANRLITMNRLRDQVREGPDSLRAETAIELLDRVITLSQRINQLQRRIESRIEHVAPQLLELPGCAGLTAAKILAETAGVMRFRSSSAFAMHAGTAPHPRLDWQPDASSPQPQRQPAAQYCPSSHRRNTAEGPPIRQSAGRTPGQPGQLPNRGPASLRRHLADVVYHRLRMAEATGQLPPP